MRALSRLIATVGGGEDPVRLAKLETLLAALKDDPDKAHTLGRCRIAPHHGRLGIFREVRKDGLPVLKLRPGERMLWDNRFRIELGAARPSRSPSRRSARRVLRALKEREALPPARCRGSPPGRCRPAGAARGCSAFPT